MPFDTCGGISPRQIFYIKCDWKFSLPVCCCSGAVLAGSGLLCSFVVSLIEDLGAWLGSGFAEMSSSSLSCSSGTESNYKKSWSPS